MLKHISEFILKLFGWQLEVTLPKEKKFVLIGAPHTSNWDFPITMLAFWSTNLHIRWVGKSQMFRGPLNRLFAALGGIPVDRSQHGGFIKQIENRFKHSEEMVLTLAPEGTRAKSQYWKSGFYHIAMAAKVPICLGYIDYSAKRIGFKKLIYPTGDIVADMKLIAAFYRSMKGKHPLKQGPVQVRPAEEK